ncbi:MAG: DNA gyrase/topoisomerase IV subunit A [Sphingomonadales bacterium]|nr:DNA gyrase/topoisomerase IV subunit A [Sphingomonadales bacterium]
MSELGPDDINDSLENPNSEQIDSQLASVLPVSAQYRTWFLDYASYVILERAIPAMEDGLKPVQRRILHAMYEMDDGRFNKVANIIGATMAYHPHGDAAIGDALVNLGQKDLLIDTQGNWGDVRTGDSAAAPRYIEARLSHFAKEVAFNEKTTEWQLSYDGRKREPVTLPMKFPLLLAQGVEGIAVGLSTKILPHNFIELCEASIDILRGKKTQILPDFPTGGQADFSQYNAGKKGGRVRVRAKIDVEDKATLHIREIPFGTTTGSLIESIIKANDSGKIKIKKVIDNTAANVDVEVQLAPGVSTDLAINALYAFTDCEVSISPLACVIMDEKPRFMSVNEILEECTRNTLHLLRRELEIQLHELEEKWHFSSLEKVFIENRIYRDIEEAETWEAVIKAIDEGLEPFKSRFRREITEDDIVRLTEIKIKRISKFDSFKADEYIRSLEDDIAMVKHHLETLVDYAVDYFKSLIKKYGKGKERKTEIRTFDTIEANVVAAANVKLYANLKEGFVGTSLKKDEFITDCSDIDDIIAFRKNGKYMISKVSDKTFFGKDLIHVDVWRKNDERTTYNVVYWDSAAKRAMVKRFNATGLIRDKEYDVTGGVSTNEVLYFTANPNGEAERVVVHLSSMANARIKQFDYDFALLAIKGKTAQGNLLTRYPIRRLDLKEKGASTLGGVKIWFDEMTGRLSGEARGQFLGEFDGDDRVLVIYKGGNYELTNYELINRYEPDQVYLIQKFFPEQIISTVYLDGKSKNYFVKRFLIETTTLSKKFPFISEEKGSQMLCASTVEKAFVKVTSENKKGEKEELTLQMDTFMDVRGWKTQGQKLSADKIKKIVLESARIGEVPASAVISEEKEDNDGNPPNPGDEPQLNLL